MSNEKSKPMQPEVATKDINHAVYTLYKCAIINLNKRTNHSGTVILPPVIQTNSIHSVSTLI